MNVAVTDHAVGRYKQRVQGATDLERESVRGIIRSIVETAFKEGQVRNHPTSQSKRVAPFQSGGSTLYLSLGPNKTRIPGELAVVSVLFEKELGKVGLGVTLGDVTDVVVQVDRKPPPRFVLLVGADGLEKYVFWEADKMSSFLAERKPGEHFVYELRK